jgi:predicted  nucleic acid-binding Zn-ribbon protein
MSRVKSLLSERESIDKELKHLREKIRKLNNRKKELEDLSVKYMKDTRTETVKFKEKTYHIEERERRKRKKDSDKKKDTIEILKEFHPKPEELYEKILEQLRGEPEKAVCLKNDPKKKK